MAGIGLSKSYVAVYSEVNGVVTYSDGVNLGPATDFDTKIEKGKDAPLYGDNGIQETSETFSGGTLTHGVTELTQEGSALILGITPKKRTIGEKEITELIYDDSCTAPYLGFGTIIKKKARGAYKHRAVMLAKVKYSIPDDTAVTVKDSIEWKVAQLTATFMRDDTPSHEWKREATFDTEPEADAYLRELLNITDAPREEV